MKLRKPNRKLRKGRPHPWRAIMARRFKRRYPSRDLELS
jgi:hypothetical protein